MIISKQQIEQYNEEDYTISISDCILFTFSNLIY